MHFGSEMKMQIRRIIGIAGNNLVRILLQAGHEVWALARSKEKARRGTCRHCRTPSHRGRARNAADFAYDLRGVDVIFHPAAYFPQVLQSWGSACECQSDRELVLLLYCRARPFGPHSQMFHAPGAHCFHYRDEFLSAIGKPVINAGWHGRGDDSVDHSIALELAKLSGQHPRDLARIRAAGTEAHPRNRDQSLREGCKHLFPRRGRGRRFFVEETDCPVASFQRRRLPARRYTPAHESEGTAKQGWPVSIRSRSGRIEKRLRPKVRDGAGRPCGCLEMC